MRIPSLETIIRHHAIMPALYYSLLSYLFQDRIDQENNNNKTDQGQDDIEVELVLPAPGQGEQGSGQSEIESGQGRRRSRSRDDLDRGHFLRGRGRRGQSPQGWSRNNGIDLLFA